MSNHRRLGSNQKRILNWLLKKTESILADDDRNARVEFDRLGIPWRVSALYSDDPSNAPKDAKIKISSSLRTLIEQRLVSVSPSGSSKKQRRTSHVKLTNQGYRYALHLLLEEGTPLPKLILKNTIQRSTSDLQTVDRLRELLPTMEKAVTEEGYTLSLGSKSTATSLSVEQSNLVIKIVSEGLEQHKQCIETELKIFEDALVRTETTHD